MTVVATGNLTTQSGSTGTVTVSEGALTKGPNLDPRLLSACGFDTAVTDGSIAVPIKVSVTLTSSQTVDGSLGITAFRADGTNAGTTFAFAAYIGGAHTCHPSTYLMEAQNTLPAAYFTGMTSGATQTVTYWVIDPKAVAPAYPQGNLANLAELLLFVTPGLGDVTTDNLTGIDAGTCTQPPLNGATYIAVTPGVFQAPGCGKPA